MVKPKKENISANNKLYQSLVVFLLALTCISVASYAWFTLSSNTKVNSMNLEIRTSELLRLDTVPHNNIELYYRVLPGENVISASGNIELAPVTSSDGGTFYTEQGALTTNTEETYLEVPLHFRASKAMYVHLSSEELTNEGGTTSVSGTQGIENALRISFTANGATKIFEPNGNSAGTFTLDNSREMVYSDENTLFYLEEDVDLQVILRIWIEGTDPECTDSLREAEYTIQLCFVGTDEDNVPYW